MKLSTILLTAMLLAALPCAKSAPDMESKNKGGEPEEAPAKADYDSLVVRYGELSAKEAELRQRLDDARRLYAEDTPGKEALGLSIMELEQGLFTLRDTMDLLSATLEAMEREQGYSLRIESNSAPTEPFDNGSPMLTDNDYFSINLPESDYAHLRQAQDDERRAATIAGQIKANHQRMTTLLSAYALASKGPQADSIHTTVCRLETENESLADSLADIWSTVFDTKIYNYNYILDKNGERDLLSWQEGQMNNLRLLMSEIRGEYMYDATANYALQKLLVTNFETKIADRAGLVAAADSLSSLVPPTSHIEDFFMPVLDTRERMFYDFADARILKQSKYTNGNQIPQVEIFPRGDMYRILLGAYTKLQPVSVFRKVYPLFREQKSTDRKHYYYAGGYATYEEAQAAAARLKKAGFRNPRVVAWHDGVYDGAPAGNGTVSPGNQDARLRYRVEISGAGNSLSRMVRDVISTQAAGKEVSRTADPDTGASLFVVGSFNTKALAESLVNAIETVEPELEMKIVTIQ